MRSHVKEINDLNVFPIPDGDTGDNIIISGKDASSDETKGLESYVKEHYPRNELYLINGGQDVYDYIIIVEQRGI
ncbi:MAG: hypothetical protein IKC87_05195 [Clostridia bacterium]|nr:hypothetical protein [Clostridia bacterium]